MHTVSLHRTDPRATDSSTFPTWKWTPQSSPERPGWNSIFPTRRWNPVCNRQKRPWRPPIWSAFTGPSSKSNIAYPPIRSLRTTSYQWSGRCTGIPFPETLTTLKSLAGRAAGAEGRTAHLLAHRWHALAHFNVAKEVVRMLKECAGDAPSARASQDWAEPVPPVELLDAIPGPWSWDTDDT